MRESEAIPHRKLILETSHVQRKPLDTWKMRASWILHTTKEYLYLRGGIFLLAPNPKAASRLMIYLAVRRIPKANDPREDRSPTIQRTKGRVQIYAIENITFMTVFHYVPIIQLHSAECIDDDNTHLGINNNLRALSKKSVCTYFVADLQFARNPLADPFCVKKCLCFFHKRANKKHVGENPPPPPPPPPPPNPSSNSVKHTRSVLALKDRNPTSNVLAHGSPAKMAPTTYVST